MCLATLAAKASVPKHTTTGPRHQVPEAAQAFGAGFPEQRGSEGGAAVGMEKGAEGKRQGHPDWSQAAASNMGLLGHSMSLEKSYLAE